MATKEQYEMCAKTLTENIREASDLEEKAALMTCVGNTRYSQYLMYREPRARRLAANCYLAAKKFYQK